MEKMKIAFGISVLGLGVLACDLSLLGGPSLPGAEEVQTSVAATVAALAGSGSEVLEPTEGPPAEPADSPLFREFAVEIDEAVRRGDAELFSSRLGRELRCTGLEEPPLEGTEQTPPPCLGQAAGVVIPVVQSAVAESDYSGLYSEGEYTVLLSEWFRSALPSEADTFGSGAPRLHATVQWYGGVPVRPASYAAVLTGIFPWEPMGVNMRQARIIGFLFDDGRWEIIGEVLATTSQTAAPSLSGDCDVCFDRWEAWADRSP